MAQAVTFLSAATPFLKVRQSEPWGPVHSKPELVYRGGGVGRSLGPRLITRSPAILTKVCAYKRFYGS